MVVENNIPGAEERLWMDANDEGTGDVFAIWMMVKRSHASHLAG